MIEDLQDAVEPGDVRQDPAGQRGDSVHHLELSRREPGARIEPLGCLRRQRDRTDVYEQRGHLDLPRLFEVQRPREALD